MKNNIIKKSNEMIFNSKYNISETSINFINYLIAKIKVEDTDFEEYIMPYTEIRKMSGITGGNNKEVGKKLAFELMSKPFTINECAYNWLSKADFSNNEYLKVRIDRDLKPYLLQLKKNFTKINLENFISLNSKYTKRLYEIAISRHNLTKYKECSIELNIDDIRTNWEIPKSYVYKNIKDLFEKAKEDINSKTEIEIDFKPIQAIRGKRIEKMVITIKPNDILKSLARFKKYMTTRYVHKTILEHNEFKNGKLLGLTIYEKELKNETDIEMKNKLLLATDEKGKLYDLRSNRKLNSQNNKMIWEELFKIAKNGKLEILKVN